MKSEKEILRRYCVLFSRKEDCCRNHWQWSVEENHEFEELEKQILEMMRDGQKLASKLRMMEISFEFINNDRNKLIKQLAELELEFEKK